MSFFNSAIGVEMIGEYIVTLVTPAKTVRNTGKEPKERDALTTEFRMP